MDIACNALILLVCSPSHKFPRLIASDALLQYASNNQLLLKEKLKHDKIGFLLCFSWNIY